MGCCQKEPKGEQEQKAGGCCGGGGHHHHHGDHGHNHDHHHGDAKEAGSCGKSGGISGFIKNLFGAKKKGCCH